MSAPITSVALCAALAVVVGCTDSPTKRVVAPTTAGTVAVTGRSSSAATTAPIGEGHLVGVIREIGGPAPGFGPTVVGTVVAIGADGSRHVATATVDGFDLALSPGVFTISATSPLVNNGQTPCPAIADTIEIESQQTTRVEFDCHIK